MVSNERHHGARVQGNSTEGRAEERPQPSGHSLETAFARDFLTREREFCFCAFYFLIAI